MPLILPHLQPGRQSRRVEVPEDTAQEGIVRFLTRFGYTVLETSRRRQRVTCAACGENQWPKVRDRRTGDLVLMGDGCDKGIGDLLVTSERMKPSVLMLEVKGTTTPTSKEQQALIDAGMMRRIVAKHSLDWTVREALRIVREWEEGL